MIPCVKCGNDMPELRKIKFGYNFCTSCSTVGTYKAVSTISGEGDHTWNDIHIVKDDNFKVERENRESEFYSE